MATGLRMSTNEREFIEAALREEQRIDGRSPFDYRRLLINFSKEDGSVEVQLGQTRILAVVSGQLTEPYPDRPNEGSLAIFTEFSPMADPAFEPGRPGEMAVELGRIIDRGLRESRAVDTESLCVLAGRSVWAIRLDISILDNGGNLVDSANIAALAALLSYRRPECTVGGDDGQEIIVHPPGFREPLPLIIHHLPIAITFAFFGDGEIEVLDPNLKEEAVMGGRLTMTVNTHGDICAVQKGGGVGVSASELMRCLRIATAKAQAITETLQKAVKVHETKRAQRKVRRHSNLTTPIEVASVTSNTVREREVEMLDPLEATTAGRKADVYMLGNTKGEEDSDSDDTDDSDDNKMEVGEVQREQEPGSEAVKVSDKEGLFEEGQSSWGDANLTPLKGGPTRGAVFVIDSEPLVKFDTAAKAVLREGVSLPRKSTGLVATTLQRKISGQIAAAAVYASQIPLQTGEEARPLGPLFSKFADDIADMESEAPVEEIKGKSGKCKDDMATASKSQQLNLTIVPSRETKAQKRKGSGVSQD